MILIYDTKQEAIDRTASGWQGILGREKFPQDITEFLWPINVGKDGRTALIADERTDQLTDQEIASASSIDILTDANWSINLEVATI